MRWFRFAVLILVATLLQASLLAYLDIKPDLLLILLVFFAISCGSSEAIISSFVVGFAADIVAPAMGPRIISFGLVGTALVYLNRVIAIKKMPYQAVVIFITGFLVGILAHLLGLLRGEPAAKDLYSILFGTSLYSALVGPFLFLPAAWWMRIKTKRF
jgi:rod shape-determining protein MreD